MQGYNGDNSQRKTSDSQFGNPVKDWQRGKYDRTYWGVKSGLPLPGAPSNGIQKACRKNSYCKAFIANEVKQTEVLHAIRGWTFTLKTQLQFFAWQRMVQEFSWQNSPASEPKMTSKNKVAFITGCGAEGLSFLAISPDGKRLYSDRNSGHSIVRGIILKTDTYFKQFEGLLNP